MYMSFRYYLTPMGRTFRGAEPMIPLPALREGIPAYPGDDIASEPIIPQPTLGEGGPAYPGDGIASEPVIPLPTPGEGGPVYPGDDITSEPVIPLPTPGEGGPVYPGPVSPPIFPRPPINSGNWDCSSGNCNTSQAGTSRVRFLHAAYGYSAFRISVANLRFVNRLSYASVSDYGRIRAGYQTVTVTGTNGRIYLQRTLPFQTNGLSIVAIIKTAGGLDLLQISDRCCPPTNGYSSFRMGNLAYNSGPIDVLMSDGRVVYGDLRYKEIAPFKRIVPGTYQFFYADTGFSPMPTALTIEPLDPAWLGVYPPYETFGSLYLDVAPQEMYTIYLLQNGSGRNNIQNLILVDR